MTVMAASSSTLLLLITTLFISPTIINARFLFSSCIDQHGNYTTNSTYHTNLNSLLPSLISNTSLLTGARASTGYYTSSRGKSPDKVYAAVLCRGDVRLDECRSCLNESRHLLAEYCPNRNAAAIWYDACTLRYSNVYFTGIMDTGRRFAVFNTQNLTSTVLGFNERVAALFENLTTRAATKADLSPRNFAAGSVSVLEDVVLYGLVQCTPDLSGPDCNDCVVEGIRFSQGCCYGSPVVYVGLLSCNVVYNSHDEFFDPAVDMRIQYLETPASPPSPPPQLSPASQPANDTSDGKVRKGGRSQIVIIIVVPSIACFLVLVICICLCLRLGTKSKKKTQTRSPFEIEEESSDHESAQSLQFNFRTIRSATNDFSDANKIGQGGFGAVYKGRLSNGQDIAVKRLINNQSSSNQRDLEFKNEVLLVARLAHRNLVRLLGFSLEKTERILVYEFMPNSSLNHFIFESDKRVHLDWNLRCKIIIGIARGLLYLHEESRLRIIHRDLKAGNILLDAEMNPKISDFGTARLFADLNQTRDQTKRIAGTYGYMAPEYARKGEFSVKSDVFSFGVLVLEIICGQRVKDFHEGESLLTYAWKNWKEGNAMKLVDPKMRGVSRHEITRCVHIGLLCVQEKAVERPTMGSVVLMLSSYSLSLRRPSRPAYFVQSNSQPSRVTKSNQSGNKYTQISGNHNVSLITELSPR